jgi:hypothetical protein
VKYWRELVAYYPDAKVLHTVRDPDQWFDSTQATIFNPGNLERIVAPGPMTDFFMGLFGEMMPQITDRAIMTDYFRRHDAEVRATVPKERLLIYPVGSGWAPLCDWLGVAVPDQPYPSENSRADFVKRVAEAH